MTQPAHLGPTKAPPPLITTSLSRAEQYYCWLVSAEFLEPSVYLVRIPYHCLGICVRGEK
jgi:hypothetical protein